MARILEFSRIPLFKSCFPEETTWFSLGASLIAGDEGYVPERFSVSGWRRLSLDLRRGVYDLVVLPAVDISYGYDAGWKKRFLRRLIRTGLVRALAARVIEALWQLKRTTVIFLDVSDNPALSYEACALVPGFLAYFKREFDPARTLRAGIRWESCNARVVPWSLFAPATDWVPDASVKKYDVFFAGHCHNAVRQQGLPQLRGLEARGYRIDVPAGRIGYQEYLRRMAEAWLVWSPEGYGWDCYRHYEAGFAGAVPVINEPPAGRLRPYEDEVECFYYQAAGEGLTDVLISALADKARLTAMAARAHARVLGHYTRAALVADMQAAIAARKCGQPLATPPAATTAS